MATTPRAPCPPEPWSCWQARPVYMHAFAPSVGQKPRLAARGTSLPGMLVHQLRPCPRFGWGCSGEGRGTQAKGSTGPALAQTKTPGGPAHIQCKILAHHKHRALSGRPQRRAPRGAGAAGAGDAGGHLCGGAGRAPWRGLGGHSGAGGRQAPGAGAGRVAHAQPGAVPGAHPALSVCQANRSSAGLRKGCAATSGRRNRPDTLHECNLRGVLWCTPMRMSSNIAVLEFHALGDMHRRLSRPWSAALICDSLALRHHAAAHGACC